MLCHHAGSNCYFLVSKKKKNHTHYLLECNWCCLTCFHIVFYLTLKISICNSSSNSHLIHTEIVIEWMGNLIIINHKICNCPCKYSNFVYCLCYTKVARVVAALNVLKFRCLNNLKKHILGILWIELNAPPFTHKYTHVKILNCNIFDFNPTWRMRGVTLIQNGYYPQKRRNLGQRWIWKTMGRKHRKKGVCLYPKKKAWSRWVCSNIQNLSHTFIPGF